VDIAWEEEGKRVEDSIEALKNTINPMDIGRGTVNMFSDYIKEAETIVSAGPLGVYEKRGFDVGTKEVLRLIARSKGYSIVAGGDLTSIVDAMGIQNEICHLSTGGGAFL